MLSVIVPVYNVKKYLAECLESVSKQTFDDIEVIVVDDGSTDGSRDYIDKFCCDKPKFKVFHKENGGLMSAWMYGVERSKGEYIGFVDSDDLVEPNMYEYMMDTAKKTGADIVMCNRKDITKTSVRTCEDNTLKPFYEGEAIEEIHNRVFPSLKGGNISSARWNKIFKRTVFVPNLIYCKDKSRYCEDRYIVPATLFSAKSFAYISEPLYIYRMRKTANSKSPSMELIYSIDRLYEIQKDMLIDKGLFNKYAHNLELAKLNYIKIAFERNLVNSFGYKEKVVTAKYILSEENRKIVLKNKSECVNKFGKMLYVAAKVNSIWILLLAARLNRITSGMNKNNWFG